MKSIKVLLVSSGELKLERKNFEFEFYRKHQEWLDNGVFLHLDILEEISELLLITDSQIGFVQLVREADLIVFLFHSKVGMYAEKIFEHTFGQFKSTQKPFIFIYFKRPSVDIYDNLSQFKRKLRELKHFYSSFNESNDLWNQFSKELDRLAADGFVENKRQEHKIVSLDLKQKTEIIYNIDKIDNASFNGGGQEKNKKPEKQNEEVSCTLYSPREVTSGDQFLVQVFAHTSKQLELIERMAHLADETSTHRGTSRLLEALEWNTKIDFNLILPGLIIDEPTLSVNWKGEIVFVQFGLKVPNDFPTSDIVGNVIIAKDSVPIGKIKFKLKILSLKSNLNTLETKNYSNEMIRFRQAFISYASEDRKEVLKRVQMLNLINLKFFQDLLTLEAGQIWEKKIYDYIDSCDVFFLFWSKAASQSEWVMKEVRYAKKKKEGNWDSPPEIIPVIIEGPPPAKPPAELNFLHFNDRFIYFINSKY